LSQIKFSFFPFRSGLGIKIVHINNARDGGVDRGDLEEKLTKLKPKVLAITHVPTNSGLAQPVSQIGRIYERYIADQPDKTWYILDACQSAGQMKLDVQDLKCDFMSVTGRKFLRGPRGTGMLYISDKALESGLEPLFIDMRGAEWTDKGNYQQQPDAKRFEDWEFAYSTVLGTSTAIEYCRNIGEERIWGQVNLLSGILRKELEGMDRVRVLDKGPELAGLVTFTVEKSDPTFIVNELARRKINVVPSYRAFGVIDFDEKGVKWAIRASPHYYNTLNEVETFIESIKEIIR
jgi:selenocysteine lyase/cysteine desulfurase